MNNADPWYALRVRNNYEKSVFDILAQKSLEGFLPTYRQRRTWSDRIKQLDTPLFPGYLFVRLNPVSRVPVLRTPGVISIVGCGRIPMPISDSEMTNLQLLVESRFKLEPWPFLNVGQRVRVQKGPLAGVEGFIQELKSDKRLIVSIELLQRSIAAELDGAWVSPITT